MLSVLYHILAFVIAYGIGWILTQILKKVFIFFLNRHSEKMRREHPEEFGEEFDEDY